MPPLNRLNMAARFLDSFIDGNLMLSAVLILWQTPDHRFVRTHHGL